VNIQAVEGGVSREALRTYSEEQSVELTAGPDGPARWRGDREFGYVSWDDARNLVDIVITSDDDTREAAAGGL
jgi:hypothetical protein